MLFRIDTQGRTAEAVPVGRFSELGLRERYDIQEWVLDNPELLGEELLVVSTEFSRFNRTSERLDVLALDRSGKLVIVELKRSAIGTLADLQALRYAAYCSNFTLDDITDLLAEYRRRRGGGDFTTDNARDALTSFVESPDFSELDDKPRIILAAQEFHAEMTATVLWLRSFEVDIRCVELSPYQLEGELVVDSRVLIPLPEAEDYIIRRERKEAERSSAGGRASRPSLEEFLEGVPEGVRPWFDKLRSTLLARGDVKETVFNTLISYRRASNNEWIAWLQHVSSEARIGLPPTAPIPAEMVVRYSNQGWPIVGVSTAEELEVVLRMIQEETSLTQD